jgi:exodeoxyribonuclease VII large subunit
VSDENTLSAPTEAVVGAGGRRYWHGADGPHAVGGYARRIKAWMDERPRIALIGEIVDFRDPGRSASVWFQLRDVDGAVPCSMWRNQFESTGLGAAELADGAKVVVAGRPSYPGGGKASPSFSFRCDRIELAGEGELLRELDRLRKLLVAEGLTERQARLPIPALPRSIGVVTGESGEARRDLAAALERRGWAGRIVWGFAPVQDRHAAPAITQAIQDLSAAGAVEAIVVTRGGGSLLDLWAFCDETLCRTVAMLPTPVIAAVGHHRDQTLIDHVAAVSCSTPTHAAEAAVRIEPRIARAELARLAARLPIAARRGLADRSRDLARAAQAPPRHVASLRTALHQRLREVRAASRERIGERSREIAQVAAGLPREPGRGIRDRRAAVEAARRTILAHDPQRTLERGYARIESGGRTVTRVAGLEVGAELEIGFADGRAGATTTSVERRPDSENGENAGDE